MRQITTTAFLGMLALTITGCPSSDNPQTTNPSPTPTPVAVTTPPAKTPPLVATNPTGAAFLAPGLIQPTNANQRIKQVAKGNRDPFAALFLPVPVAPISTGNISNAPTQAPQIGTPTASNQIDRRQTSRTVTNRNRQFSSGSVASNSRTAINSRTATNRSTPTNPGTATNPRTATNSINRIPTPNQNPGLPPNPTQPNGGLQPELPPPPADTTLANNVVVMGVIQIGEQTQAIVQVPSEATSRYVQVGQTLSNGQVLVKRIELNAGAEPIVILEQYGVEISKAVGEQSPSQEQQTTPTAALPLSSPNPSTTTAAVPFIPPQNTSTTTTELPAPPQNTNPVGTTISVPALQPSNPITPALAN